MVQSVQPSYVYDVVLKICVGDLARGARARARARARTVPYSLVLVHHTALCRRSWRMVLVPVLVLLVLVQMPVLLVLMVVLLVLMMVLLVLMLVLTVLFT